MKLIATSRLLPFRRFQLLAAVTAALLPVTVHTQAQDSLSTYVDEVVGCYGCSTDEGQRYHNEQNDVPNVTSLTEDHSLSNSVASQFGHVSTVFGSASATVQGQGVTVEVSPNRVNAGGTLGDCITGWTMTRTISAPGYENQFLNMRETMHASGGLTARASQGPETSGDAYYSISVGPGLNYSGEWNAATGYTGTHIADLATFTYDRQIGSDNPFTISYQVRVNDATGGGDEPGNYGYGSGNISLRSGTIEVFDPNTNLPVDYTLTSNAGSARGKVTAAGTIYGGFSVTNTAPDRFGSTFQILDGTASHDTNVVATFVAPLDIKAASDVVDLTGTDGDLQVVQIDFDPGFANFGPLQYFGVLFIGHNGGTHWVNAALGNYDGPPPTFVGFRAYNPATDFHLGYEGIDNTNHKVWAVINHNSLFAAGIPFDLVSVVSRKTHGSAGDFDINLPLTGNPGIECRSGGANGNHTLVFTFKTNLASGQVSVASGGGSISGAPTMSGNTMTVNLTGVPDGQVTALTLHNMTDAANQLLDDTTVSVGFLVGDANGDGNVNSADATFTRNRSGQATGAINFRADYNLDGNINSADATITRRNSGHGLHQVANE